MIFYYATYNPLTSKWVVCWQLLPTLYQRECFRQLYSWSGVIPCYYYLCRSYLGDIGYVTIRRNFAFSTKSPLVPPETASTLTRTSTGPTLSNFTI